jgi:hypothetical protein
MSFIIKPTFDCPLEYPEKIRDVKTGIWIPKRAGANKIWREKLLRQAENDIGLQKDLMAACKESYLFWFNAFAWTYHQFEIDPVEHKKRPADVTDWPMMTWPVQDRAIDFMDDCFRNGEDGLLHKSRAMGASWICLGYLHWLWLFRSSQTEIREMSRQEGLVDGNADSLFWKHDYINKWLPDWMRPAGVLVVGRDNRTRLRIYNESNGNTIGGEATTSVSLSGGRAAILFLDEFAKVANGDKIRSSTRPVAACRIINSTSYGAGTEYARWRKSGQIKTFALMFWNHPEMGRGRYITQDELGNYNIRSPWFDNEEKYCTKQEIAQEVLAEDIESGETVFNISNIDKHIALYSCQPKIQMNIILKDKIPEVTIKDVLRKKDINAVDFRQVKEGKLLVWGPMVLGRPDQSKHYIFGIDTSKGQGASESVVSIKCKETGEKIARWSDANTPPHEFSKIVVALAIWCGGALPYGLPFIKWEENGPGWDLGRLLVKVYCYPYYYINERPGVIGSGLPNTKLKYGWHASEQAKTELLALYDRILGSGNYINHDLKALEQAKFFIHYPGGGCGPAQLQYESKMARKLHGDIVIADALTLEDEKIMLGKKARPETPSRSFEFRFDQFKNKNKKIDSWRKAFNFAK